jgi:hypothetical protein
VHIGGLQGRRIWIWISIERVRMEAFGMRDFEQISIGKRAKWRVLFSESSKCRLDYLVALWDHNSGLRQKL